MIFLCKRACCHFSEEEQELRTGPNHTGASAIMSAVS